MISSIIPLLLFVLLLCCPSFAASARLFDDALLQAWHELLVLQINQSAIAHRDHPVDERILTALRKCSGGGFDTLSAQHGTTTTVNGEAEDDGDRGSAVMRMGSAASSASTLAPQRVEIYAEIGHLTQFCVEEEGAEQLMAKRRTTIVDDMQQLAEEFRDKCSDAAARRSSSPSSSSSSSSSSNFVTLSLAQMFDAMGARVDTITRADAIVVGDAHAASDGANGGKKNLQEWTRQMVDTVQRTVPAHSERWKLVLIAPGLYDIPYGKSSAVLAQDVLQSVQLIRHGLPRRTFLLILRQSNFTFWRSVAKTAAFCSKMLSLWDLGRAEEDERAWDLLEARLRAVYGEDEQFHVQMVDLMERARPVITASNYADLSPLASDCVHLSPRGLSLLHIQLWNWLVQPRVRHTQPFVPLLRPPLCPRPHCPFLATSRNIISCPRLSTCCASNDQIASSSSFSSPLRLFRVVRLSPIGTILLLLLFGLFLIAIGSLISYNICSRRRRNGGDGFSPLIFAGSGGDRRRRSVAEAFL